MDTSVISSAKLFIEANDNSSNKKFLIKNNNIRNKKFSKFTSQRLAELFT
jgi:hypothetical protein